MDSYSETNNGTLNSTSNEQDTSLSANNGQTTSSSFQPHLSTPPTYRSDPVRNITSTIKTQPPQTQWTNSEKGSEGTAWTASQQEQYLNMLKQAGYTFLTNNSVTGQVPFPNYSFSFPPQQNMYYYSPEMYGYYPQQWANLSYMQPMNAAFLMGQQSNISQGENMFNMPSTIQTSESDTLEHLAAQHAAVQLYNKSLEYLEGSQKITTNSEQQTEEYEKAALQQEQDESKKPGDDDETVTNNLESLTDHPTFLTENTETTSPNEPNINFEKPDDNYKADISNDYDMFFQKEEQSNDFNAITSTRATSSEFLSNGSVLASPAESNSSSPPVNSSSPSIIPIEPNISTNFDENSGNFSDYSSPQHLIDWAKSLLEKPDCDDLKQIKEWASVYSFVYHGRPYTDEEAVQLYIYYIQSQNSGDGTQMIGLLDPNNSLMEKSWDLGLGLPSLGYNDSIQESLPTLPDSTMGAPATVNPIVSMKTHLEAHKKSVEAARYKIQTKETNLDNQLEPHTQHLKAESSQSPSQDVGDLFHLPKRTPSHVSQSSPIQTAGTINKSIHINVDPSILPTYAPETLYDRFEEEKNSQHDIADSSATNINSSPDFTPELKPKQLSQDSSVSEEAEVHEMPQLELPQLDFNDKKLSEEETPVEVETVKDLQNSPSLNILGDYYITDKDPPIFYQVRNDTYFSCFNQAHTA